MSNGLQQVHQKGWQRQSEEGGFCSKTPVVLQQKKNQHHNMSVLMQLSGLISQT